MYRNVLIVCIYLVTSTLLVLFVMWTNGTYELNGPQGLNGPVDQIDLWFAWTIESY